MIRVKLTVEYDGTNYAGWQRQTNALSVQQALENAFEKASGERVVIHGAGRTDAGVHAQAQVAHMDTQCTIPPEKICFAINMQLPADIRVKHSEQVDDSFHARFCAKGKTYRYTIYNSIHAPAIFRNLAAHVRGRFDVDAMREAAAYVCGTHDFACFCAGGSDVKDTVRQVYRLTVEEKAPFIYIDITGSGFLYHMVRIIAGTLIEIGLTKRPPSCMCGILDGSARAGATAPARGLTLKTVYYTSPEKETE